MRIVRTLALSGLFVFGLGWGVTYEPNSAEANYRGQRHCHYRNSCGYRNPPPRLVCSSGKCRYRNPPRSYSCRRVVASCHR